MARRGAAGCIAMLRAVLNSGLLKRPVEIIEQQRERIEVGNLRSSILNLRLLQPAQNVLAPRLPHGLARLEL
jgi:hypothetical protein